MSLQSPASGSGRTRGRTAARIATALALTALLGGSMAACAPTDAGSGGDGTPVEGGTLTLGVGLPLQDFDPYQGVNQNYIMARTLYSNLIYYTEDLQPEPDIATEWEIADDNLSVTITLRDAVFADGDPVTADDVVAGIERAKSPDTGFTQRGVAEFIESAEAVDDHTVTVNFLAPTSEDRILDWMFYFPVVKAENNNPDFLKTAAAGSGPFMVESYDPGTQLTLVKNPNYYKEGRPYLDEVVFRFFSDQDAMVAALQSGDVDGTVWGELRYDAQLESTFQLVDGSLSAQTQLFYVNPAMAPFDDVECRQAIFRAIDREGIRQQVQGDRGVIVPGPFPPSSPAYDESLFDEVGFDLDAAREGIEENCATTSAVGSVSPSVGVSTAFTKIQADLAEVGFDLQLENMDNATFVSLVREGKLQMAIFPTVNPFRSVASLSTNRGFSGGERNYWWFGQGVPQDYVDALEAVRSAITPEEVMEANAQFNQALVDNAWATGLYTMIDRASLSQEVQGFRFALGSQLILDDAYVTE